MERKFNDQELNKRNKLKKIQEQKNDPFLITKFERNFNTLSFKQSYNQFNKDDLHAKTDKIIMAGRVLAIRQTFGVISDFYGKTQFYINKKNQPETFNLFTENIDLGDIIGIEGTPMKTNTGELTINVKKITLLSKSLRPLPEK
jgi:lysyl-tRNA synthetase class 2